MLDSLTAGAPASAKTLAELCDRVAMSLDAGIDVRRVWRSESKRLSGRGARACAEVAEAIEAGIGLDQAVADAGPYFPPLMRELVGVGEQTGTLTEVFRRLSQHYGRQVSRAREFRSAIAWPVLQLAAALAVVGLMIALGGLLDDGRGQPLDFLGFGLVGERGLLIYANLLFGVGLAIGLAWMAVRRRPDWGAAARGWASRLPVVGVALQKIAMARIAWTLRLTMNVEMDITRVVRVTLRASDNTHYSRHAEAIAASVRAGTPLPEAFERAGVFPHHFIDALHVAEQSGQIVETMDRLSKRYDEEAEHAVETLSRVFAFLVWLAVAGLIIALIFRVFGIYLGAINDALGGL